MLTVITVSIFVLKVLFIFAYFGICLFHIRLVHNVLFTVDTNIVKASLHKIKRPLITPDVFTAS